MSSSSDEPEPVVIDHSKLNADLRAHLENIAKDHEELANIKSQMFSKYMEENDQLNERATEVRQEDMVIKGYHSLVHANKMQAISLRAGVTYSVQEFIDKLRLENLDETANATVTDMFRRCGNTNVTDRGDDNDDEDDIEEQLDQRLEEDCFYKLGLLVRKDFAVAPSIDFMFGPIEMERRKPRSVRYREKPSNTDPGKRKVAEEVPRLEKEKQYTEEKIAEMYKKLKHVDSANYYDLVMDPTSFSNTVENVFHSAFLVKDRRAQMQVQDRKPVIKVLAKDEVQASTPVEQMIFRFDYKFWEKLRSSQA